jgi:ArsR family transcriptional regulator, arsenate/arsenite/antimonite-responsive transcriptional repressor
LNTFAATIARPKSPKTPPKATSAIRVSARTINRLADVFRMLADESRLKILLALAQDGELHVTALCDLLGQTQPAVSHHLTLLRMTGLVGYRRDGKHNFYRIESGPIGELLEQFFADSGNGHKQFQFDDFCLSYKRK